MRAFSSFLVPTGAVRRGHGIGCLALCVSDGFSRTARVIASYDSFLAVRALLVNMLELVLFMLLSSFCWGCVGVLGDLRCSFDGVSVFSPCVLESLS